MQFLVSFLDFPSFRHRSLKIIYRLPMCVAKPRPLSCGADCWRVLLNENSEPSTNEQELAVLLPAVPFVFPALGRSEAADALDRTALTEASFRKLLERLAHNQD